jgi:hypothetical protein
MPGALDQLGNLFPEVDQRRKALDDDPLLSSLRSMRSPEPRATPSPSEDEGFVGGLKEAGRGVVRGTMEGLPTAVGNTATFIGREINSPDLIERGQAISAKGEQWAKENPEYQESATSQRLREANPLSIRGSAYAAGQNTPLSSGPALAGAAVGAGIGATVGGVGAIPGAMAGYVVGSLAALPLFGGQQAEEAYQSAYKYQKSIGKSDEEANAAGMASGRLQGLIEVGTEFGSDLLDFALLKGSGALGVKTVTKDAVKKMFGNSNIIKQAAKVLGLSTTKEIGEEMVAQSSQAEVEKAYAGGPGASWGDTAQVIVPTALMTLVPGTFIAGHNVARMKATEKALTDPKADPAERAIAASQVWNALPPEQPDLRAAWQVYAFDQIAQGKPIELTNDARYVEHYVQQYDEAQAAAMAAGQEPTALQPKEVFEAARNNPDALAALAVKMEGMDPAARQSLLVKMEQEGYGEVAKDALRMVGTEAAHTNVAAMAQNVPQFLQAVDVAVDSYVAGQPQTQPAAVSSPVEPTVAAPATEVPGVAVTPTTEGLPQGTDALADQQLSGLLATKFPDQQQPGTQPVATVAATPTSNEGQPSVSKTSEKKAAATQQSLLADLHAGVEANINSGRKPGERMTLDRSTITLAAPDTEQAKLAAAIKKAFGIETLFVNFGDQVRDTNGNTVMAAPPMGASMHSGAVIIVNLNRPAGERSVRNTMGHELTHQMKVHHPDLYDALKAAAQQHADSKHVSKFKAELGRQMMIESKGAATQSDIDLVFDNEIASEVTGEMWEDQGFWNRVFELSPDTAFAKRMMTAVKQLIDKLHSAMINVGFLKGEGSIQKMREASARAFVEWEQRHRAKQAAEKVAKQAAKETAPATGGATATAPPKVAKKAAKKKAVPAQPVEPKAAPADELPFQRAEDVQKALIKGEQVSQREMDRHPSISKPYAALKQVLEHAKKLAPDVLADLDVVAAKSGGVVPAEAKQHAIKSVPRGFEKVMEDYEGNAYKLKDALRSTIIVHDVNTALPDIMRRLRKRFDAVELKRNGWQEGLSKKRQDKAGYKDALIYVVRDGMKIEVQVNTAAMFYAKEGGLTKEFGHYWYEIIRALDGKRDPYTQRLTFPEEVIYKNAVRQSRVIYAEAATKSRNAASSIGTPSDMTVVYLNGRLVPASQANGIGKSPSQVTETGVPSAQSKNSVPGGNLSGSAIATSKEQPNGITESVQPTSPTEQGQLEFARTKKWESVPYGKSESSPIGTRAEAVAAEAVKDRKRLGKCHVLAGRKVAFDDAFLDKTDEQRYSLILGVVNGHPMAPLRIWHSLVKDRQTGNVWEPISDRWYTPDTLREVMGYAPVKETSAADLRKLIVKHSVWTDQTVLKPRGWEQDMMLPGEYDPDWSIHPDPNDPAIGVDLQRVEAVHYSHSPRTVLAGAKFGTGIKGEELPRLAQSTDPRIKKRVYFYLSEKGELPKREAGLGPVAHRAALDNLWDGTPALNYNRDQPLPQRLNAMESAILDAGFDGYINRRQNMAVVLNKDVPITQPPETVAFSRTEIQKIVDDGEYEPYPLGVMESKPILRALGFIRKLALVVTPEKVRKIVTGKYGVRVGLTAQQLEDIGKSLERPVAVFKSAGGTDSVVFITDQVVNGKPLIAILRRNTYVEGRTNTFSGRERYGKEVHALESAYWLGPGSITKWLKNEKPPKDGGTPLLYLDHDKANVLPEPARSELRLADKGKRKFLRPADLVNFSRSLDNSDQYVWLQAEAEKAGYKDVDDLVQKNFPLFLSLAQEWREKHPSLDFNRFYSALSKEVSTLPDKTLPPQGWIATVRNWVNKGKVKQSEVDWSGLLDMLSMANRKFTKDDILYFLDASGVKVEDAALRDQRTYEVMDAKGRRSPIPPHYVYRTRTLERAAGPFEDMQAALEARDQLNKDELPVVGRPEYEKWTLPGGDGYTELLLHIPARDVDIMIETLQQQKRTEHAVLSQADSWIKTHPNATPEEIADINRQIDEATTALMDINKRLDRLPLAKPQYRGGHYGDKVPNVVAHIRFKTRYADGKKILFIEEIQSDWADKVREGRGKEQYEIVRATLPHIGEETWVARSPDGRMVFPSRDRGEVERAIERVGANRSAPGPFVGSTNEYVDLAIKRMVLYGTENDYDAIAWATGAQNASHYNLSRVVKNIQWYPNPSGWNGGPNNILINADLVQAADGDNMLTLIADRATGKIVTANYAGGELNGKQLAEAFGKDIAQQMAENDHGHIKDKQLDVGGGGMKAFYDTIVPLRVNKLLQKLDVGVQVDPQFVNIQASPKPKYVFRAEPYTVDGQTKWWEVIRYWNDGTFEPGTGTIVDGDSAMNLTEAEATRLAARRNATAGAEVQVTVERNRDNEWEVAQYEGGQRVIVLQTLSEQAARDEQARRESELADIAQRKQTMQQGFPLTPYLKEKVAGGLPLFQRGMADLNAQSTPQVGQAFLALRKANRSQLAATNAGNIEGVARFLTATDGYDGPIPVGFDEDAPVYVYKVTALKPLGLGDAMNGGEGLTGKGTPDRIGIDTSGTKGEIQHVYSFPAENNSAYTAELMGIIPMDRLKAATVDLDPENISKDTPFDDAGYRLTAQAIRNVLATMPRVDFQRVSQTMQEDLPALKQAAIAHGYTDVNEWRLAQPIEFKKVVEQIKATPPQLSLFQRTYAPRLPGEDVKTYMKRVIDTQEVPASIPFQPRLFFKMDSSTQMIPINALVSGKTEEENQKGGQNSPKRFQAVADGVLSPRDPIDVEANGDGTYTVLDGNGTYTMLKRYGWPAVPAHVVEGVEFARAPAVQGYNFRLPAETRTQTVQRLLQDRFNRMGVAQRVVQAAGGQVSEAANVVLAEERYHGKVAYKLQRFKDKIVRPTLDDVRKDGVAPEDVAMLMYATHAQERNREIAAINPTMPDGGSGMTNKEAARILQIFQQSPDYATLKKHADRFWNIAQMTRDTMVNAGLITPTVYNGWQSRFKNYVPLKGFEIIDELGQQGTGTGTGFDVRGPESLRMKGRESRAGQILENIILDHERAIVRAEKNKVGKALLNFVLANPDPALWAVNKIEQMASFYKSGTVNAHGLLEGEVRYSNRVLDRPGETIIVKHYGQEYAIWLKDPGMRDAMLAKGGLFDRDAADVNRIMQAWAGVNRFLAKMWTSLNPVFTTINFTRDFLTGMIHAGNVGGTKYAATVAKDVFPMMKGIWDVEFRKDETTPAAKWYLDYQQEGGKAGFYIFGDMDERVRELQSLMEAAHTQTTGRKAWYATKEAVQKLEDVVMAANGMIENAIRVSAYKNAVEQGKSKAEAASIAKNLTVNFNRKGQLTPILSSLYLFFNPAVQGTTRIMQAAKKNPAEFAAMTGALVALGIMFALLGANDKDEEEVPYWDRLPGYEKQRSLVIMKGDGTGDRWTIPLPYGYGFFVNLGYGIADLWRGRPQSAVGLDQLMSLSQHFNPLGTMEEPTAALVPTVLDPLFELASNKKATGAPLMPDEEKLSGQPVPDSERYWGNTRGTALQQFTTWLNEATGGTKSVPGAISVSPETIKNFARYYTGGLGSFLMDGTQSAIALTELNYDEVARKDQIPFVRQWYKHGNVRSDTAYFMEAKKQALQALDEAKKFADSDRPEVLERIDRRSTIASLGRSVQNVERAMRSLRLQEVQIAEDKELSFAEKERARREVEEQRQQLLREWNARFYRAEIESRQ